MECTGMVFRLLSSSYFLSYYLLFYMHSLGSVTTTTTTTTFGLTNETDRQALIAIKDLIREDPFQALSSWNNSLHFCNWHGVTCSHLHQRVTVLNMSSLKFTGSVSPYIGNLSFLREINLQDNNFHTTIPQEVGRLFRLRYIRLANNLFYGKFPTSLTQCTDLRVIDLRGNNLKGTIPAELSSLTKLYGLSLARNNLTGSIPPSLGNLSYLRILGLSRNNLQGSIPTELGQLSMLEAFELSSNNLSGTVPAQIYNISSMQTFSIPNNLLTGPLPPNLGLTLPKLNLFLAAKNQFFGSIPASLANASGLEEIEIGDNVLTGPIPLNLGSLKDLRGLHFGGNPLGHEANDIGFLLSSLTNCTKLRNLSLFKIQIGGVLPNSIANLSVQLETVWLNQNYISGSIPVGIGNLVSLSYLTIDTNMLTGNIPDSIGKLTNLQELYLFENNISGRIPSSIGNITGLGILILEDNMLEGSIPVSLGNCSGLQGLHLALNHLSGAIPEQVFALSSLSVGVNLAGNYLTGSLPSQVGNMKNLALLHISNNKLTGEIPSTIGSCLMLDSLHMEGNLFEGTIPSTLGNLKGIQEMDLSRNNLTGQIPKSLAKLRSITNLNLSFNMLEGEVPNEGVFTNISEFSVLGNKKLCGGIAPLNLPACSVEVTTKHRKFSARTIIILATTMSIAIVLLLAGSCAIFLIKRSKQQSSLASTEENQHPKISYAELLRSTNEFSTENLIGEGRYGSVYKGVLNSGEQTVAVKVLKLEQRGADKSFLAECEALRNLRHRNLVKIVTSCSSIDFKGNDFKALVFEFMPNGSLDIWLHPSSSEQQDIKNLNITQRLNIAIDVASALDYLHYHCETPIVHCDLKPNNVLLDNDLCAHVSDFGLAKFLSTTSDVQSSSIGIRGTVGYVAPEYGMGGEVSTQGDVYSYGILLLEMFTGKRPTDSIFTENFGLHNYVKMALPHRVMEIVDPQISFEEEDGFNLNKTIQSSKGSMVQIEECLASIFRVGVSCSTEMPRERMDIKDVLRELHPIRKVLLQA